jgi:hypothetical protein
MSNSSVEKSALSARFTAARKWPQRKATGVRGSLARSGPMGIEAA